MGTKVPQGLHLKPPWKPQTTVREILLPLLLWYRSVQRLLLRRTNLPKAYLPGCSLHPEGLARTATRKKKLPKVTPHYLCVCATLSSIGPSRLPWPSGSSARVSPGIGSTNPQPCRGHHSQHAGER